MIKRVLKTMIFVMALSAIIAVLYFGWSLPHAWVFGTICSGMTEPSELFMVVDSNFKSAELRVEEYARLNSKCTQIVEVIFVKEIGRTPWRKYGVES